MASSADSSALLLYIAVALLLLIFLLSYSPGAPLPHRRLKIRSASSPAHDRCTPFDPIISDIERRREDWEWKRAHFMDAEGYINDEDWFNVTYEIVELYPKIDVGPADGHVRIEELTESNLRQAEQEMGRHDRDRDGFISFQEYEPPRWVQRSTVHTRADIFSGGGHIYIQRRQQNSSASPRPLPPSNPGKTDTEDIANTFTERTSKRSWKDRKDAVKARNATGSCLTSEPELDILW